MKFGNSSVRLQTVVGTDSGRMRKYFLSSQLLMTALRLL